MKQGAMKKISLWLGLALIFCANLPGAGARAAASPKTVTEKRYDLDGDGKKDSISVVFDDFDRYHYQKFTIKIGGQALMRRGDSILPKIFVVDIDKEDGRKEVIICDDGPSDDPISHCFSFQYGELYDLGTLQGHPENTRSLFKINGDGTVTTAARSDLLQTWWCGMPYRLDEWTHRFELVEQKVYDSNAKYPVTVKKSFKVYRDKSTSAQTYTLKAGQKITLNGTDNGQWVRFADSKGKTGWILMDAERGSQIKGYGPGEQYLKGISYFD